MNRIDKKRIISYLQATNNEIALDILFYKMLNVRPADGQYIPRPAKLQKHFSNPLIKIIKFFWKYIIAYLLFFKQLISYFIGQHKFKKLEEINQNSNVGVAFSDRAIDIIHDNNCDVTPEYWIVFPWTDSSKVKANTKTIHLLSLVSKKQLIKAFCNAVRSHQKIRKSPSSKNWIFQSYTAFHWFVARLALENIEAKFYIAEHFDRWAVLMDSILVNQNRKSSKTKSSLTLVQHGLVANISGNKLILPYKLQGVNALFLYNHDSKEYFLNNILTESISSDDINVEYYNNLLDLTPVNDEESLNILFVGHSICRDLQINILKYLSEKYNFVAYYKPHPTEKIIKEIYEYNWIIIEDRLCFPKVDFLISYPSTLINEYKLLNITTVEHPIDLKIDAIHEFILEVEKEIEYHLTKKKSKQ